MGAISLLITTKNANAMGRFNDVIDEIFTKKGIVAFVSGSAGGMIYGTSVTWKNVTRFVLIVVSSGMAARFATPTLSKICGVTNHDDELFLAFIVGMGGTGAYGYINGDPVLLLTGWDYDGNNLSK